MRLCVLHNLYFYNTMMEEIRDAFDHDCNKEYIERIRKFMVTTK